MGWELTGAGQQKIEAAASQIREASLGVTAAKIVYRAAVFAERFPRATVIVFALEHHWANLRLPTPVEVAPAEPHGWREVWRVRCSGPGPQQIWEILQDFIGDEKPPGRRAVGKSRRLGTLRVS